MRQSTGGRLTPSFSADDVAGHWRMSDCVMHRCALWASAITMLSLVGSAPEIAWGQMNRVGSGRPSLGFSTHLSRAPLASRRTGNNVAIGRLRLQEVLGLRRRGLTRNTLPAAIWPYGLDSPIQAPYAAEAVPLQPEVLVIAGSHGDLPENTTPQTPPDYSYVAGCHAIPNGYHCDNAHNEMTR
jgi:hypothetical protein